MKTSPVIAMASSRKFDEEGYEYKRTSKATRSGTQYYGCVRPGCSARMILYKDGSKSLRNEHNHLPFTEQESVDALVDEMKAVAKTVDTPVPQIYKDHLARACQQGLDVYFPSFSAIKTSLYRARNQLYPQVPVTPHQFVPTGDYALTLANQSFVLVDKTYTVLQSQMRMLVFGTLSNVKTLSHSSLWLMDGTFSRVPVGWTQLFTIH